MPPRKRVWGPTFIYTCDMSCVMHMHRRKSPLLSSRWRLCLCRCVHILSRALFNCLWCNQAYFSERVVFTSVATIAHQNGSEDLQLAVYNEVLLTFTNMLLLSDWSKTFCYLESVVVPPPFFINQPHFNASWGQIGNMNTSTARVVIHVSGCLTLMPLN